MKRIKRVLNVLGEKQQQQQQQQQKLLVTKFVLDPSRDSTCCACPLLKCNHGSEILKAFQVHFVHRG